MRSRLCCPTYYYNVCLFPNAEQTVEQDETEIVIPSGTLYAPSATVANCIALEIAEGRLRQELCEEGPTADPQTLETPFETPLNITLTGSDPLGGTLIYTLDTLPTNGSLSGTPPNLIYTPNTGYDGPDSFDFTVNNGYSTSTATISITVFGPPTGCLPITICDNEIAPPPFEPITQIVEIDCTQIDGIDTDLVINGFLTSAKIL